jgi:DegV family protein with EDD domain
MNKTFFNIDSAGDLPQGIIEHCADIQVIPLYIILGDKSFRDGITVFAEDIIDYVEKTNALPKTSAATVGDYFSVFSRLTDEGFDVVHISLSSKISSSFQNALITSQDFDNVYVVDSLCLSSAMALLLLKGCEMRDLGFSAEETAKELERARSSVVTTFIIDKLDYLHKGGRCSALSVLGANALGIKPCIGMHEGSLHVQKKYRGRLLQCQLTYIDDILTYYGDKIDYSTAILGYTPGLSPENEKFLKNRIKENHSFKEILVAQPGCTITSHCGPNTLAVFFMINA